MVFHKSMTWNNPWVTEQSGSFTRPTDNRGLLQQANAGPFNLRKERAEFKLSQP
jgi:hypothetical protein